MPLSHPAGERSVSLSPNTLPGSFLREPFLQDAVQATSTCDGPRTAGSRASATPAVSARPRWHLRQERVLTISSELGSEHEILKDTK